MQIVQNWLDGPRNYFVGVSIYDTIGDDDLLKDLFAKGETSHSKKRLEDELQAFLTSGGTELLPEPEQAQETEEIPPADDSVLNALREEYMPIYQEMNMLRHRLDQYEDNSPAMIEARRPLAFQILELEQQCMHIWAKRDHYKKHGRLPDVKLEEDPIPVDPIALGKYMENVKKSIRRNRWKMDKYPGKPIYAQLYNDYKTLYFKITGQHYVESTVR